MIFLLIIGLWQYTGFQYEGHTYPRLDPALNLRFHFQTEHVVSLRWDYGDETKFCESRAVYEVRGGSTLYQKVIWLNPKNDSSCGKDPDMQLGKESVNNFTVSETRLLLELEMSGKPLIYILEKIP